MKLKGKYVLLMIGLLEFTDVFSQDRSWTEDSLGYYEETFWSQVKSQKSKEAKETVDAIIDKGSAELTPEVVDFFKGSLQRSKEIPYPEVLGNLEIGLGTLEYYRGDITAAKELSREPRLSIQKPKCSIKQQEWQ
ncbi:hypothetical protein [Algoriphagus boritolerans]|uniref:hypothetical protein n=1 Tax=Algoriphagus boritolerans TaxID=308111 RepID=UPI000A85CF2C